MICRHCQKSEVNRPRGLCWSCYYRPGVRDLYPSKIPPTVHGSGWVHHKRILPAAPCPFPPGSPGRVATLARRAERGETLFHPADVRMRDIED